MLVEVNLIKGYKMSMCLDSAKPLPCFHKTAQWRHLGEGAAPDINSDEQRQPQLNMTPPARKVETR